MKSFSNAWTQPETEEEFQKREADKRLNEYFAKLHAENLKKMQEDFYLNSTRIIFDYGIRTERDS